MRIDHTGSGIIPFKSTAATPGWVTKKTTSKWLFLGGAYKSFAMQVAAGTTVATSALTVKLFAAVSTASTGGTNIITCTSANRLKFSTGNVPYLYLKFSCTKFTTAAGRQLRCEVIAAG